MSQVIIRERGGSVRFTVRVQPRASRSEVVGLHDGALRVRVQAPPAEGAANDALMVLLAKLLDVPRKQLRIVAGATSRSKVIEVDGIDPERIERLATTS